MTYMRLVAVATLACFAFLCPAAAASANDPGQVIYRAVCSACHGPENVMVSAPKAGDTAEWAARLSRAPKGLDTLTDNALAGFAAMPPKGGNSKLSREQLRLAIVFMMTPALK